MTPQIDTVADAGNVPAPEKLRYINRKKPAYRIKKVCQCCGAANAGPHHIIPRSEGGLPVFDNIIWLCIACHDEVEGPSVGALDRIEARRKHCKENRRAEPSPTPVSKPSSLLDELRGKRESQGYLEAHDAKLYHFMLADLGQWDKLSTWCLWNHQNLHVEALELQAHGDDSGISAELKHVIATMPTCFN